MQLFDITRSNTTIIFFSSLHLLAAFALGFTNLPVWVVVIALLGLIYSLKRILHCHVLRFWRQPSGRFQLQLRDGSMLEADLDPRSTLTSVFASLCFNTPHKRIRVFLFKQDLKSADLHHLRASVC